MNSSECKDIKTDEIVIDINDALYEKYDELLNKMNDIIKKSKKAVKTK